MKYRKSAETNQGVCRDDARNARGEQRTRGNTHTPPAGKSTQAAHCLTSSAMSHARSPRRIEGTRNTRACAWDGRAAFPEEKATLTPPDRTLQ
ncbi:hypothetical protein O3P69_013163 [Scylla paramamosain]|uniref:Uncharacterized protein n=1 Tax=Scylla paramamosain TaxID=85552 RepID=A0AAW0TZP4_SCYPA